MHRNLKIVLMLLVPLLVSSKCTKIDDVELKVIDVDGRVYNVVTKEHIYHCSDFAFSRELICVTGEELSAIYRHCPKR